MHRALSAFLGAIAGIFVLCGSMGLIGSWVISAALGLTCAVGMAVLFHRSRWIRIDPEVCPPALRTVSLMGMVVALLQLSRLAVFVVSPDRAEFSFLPASQWEVRHACTTAYFVAARASSSGVDVYRDSLYTAPDDDPTKIRKSRKLGAFNIDVYEYPPPFLLLPRALLPLAPEFLDYRMLWFGVCGIGLLLATVAVPPLLGSIAGTRALLLSPLLWAAIPTFSLLQKGNVQGLVIAMAMLAMVLFHRGHRVAGGALLAFATLSKLFPGMLVVYLLARRQWRAVAWTCAFSLAFVVLSFLLFGAEMYRSFLDHLPRLLSGEAFPAFRNPSALAMNFSIPTFLFKLKPFGVTGIDFSVSRVVGWIYTVLVVLVTVLAARRTRGREPLVWLAILILATLRSPFIPQAYAAVPPLWLLPMMVAFRDPTWRMLAGTLLAWAALNVYVPHDLGADPRIMAILNLAPLGVTLALSVRGLREGAEEETASAAVRSEAGSPGIASYS
ncbi:MAG TPA: glycosyltransferase family 87 protein [Candidatus Eisenbacteria bacterium]|nr:glycosyltransferase family 87 protein [Candidatus Eisenbacteria bacterium]